MTPTSQRPTTIRLPTLRAAAGLVFVTGVLARLLGLLREILIANEFGVSAQLDFVYLGLSVPLALAVGIGGSLVRATVPIASRLDDRAFAGLARAGTQRLFRTMTPVALGLALTSPLWVHLLTIGSARGPSWELYVSAFFGCLALVTVGVTGLLGGLANGRGNHVTTSINPLTYNLIVIGAIVLLHRPLGVLSILAGVVAAEYHQVLVHGPAVARMTRGIEPQARRRDWDALKRLFWPSAAAGVLMGLNVAVDRVFAGTLRDGSIAALAYADRLINLPVGLFAAALTVPLYTRLSRFRATGNPRAFHLTLLLGIRMLLLVGLPSAVFFVWAARPIVGLLFMRGEFGMDAIAMTATALQGYSVGIPFLTVSVLLFMAGMTIKRPWLVVWVMGACTILNGVLDWLLVKPFGLMGIAVTTSIVAAARSAILCAIVSRWLFGSEMLWRPVVRVATASIVLAAALWGTEMVLGLGAADTRWAWAMMLAAGVCASGVVLAVLWRPVLREEMRTLGRLRTEVAGFVAGERGE